MALRSEQVVELLQRKFISSWSLVKELEEMAVGHVTNEEVRRMARASLDSYTFPVQINILLPNSTLVGTLNANDWLNVDEEMASSADNKEDYEAVWSDEAASANYLRFLRRALAHLDL